MKAVFVTGATGFIGKQLVANLINDGVKVYALSRKANCELASITNIKIIAGDITGKVVVPSEVETIYHCAGIILQEDLMEEVNVRGTQRIVDTALKQNCRLIHLSSGGVVGKAHDNTIDETTECRPQNLYEHTKYEAEKIVMKGVSMGLKAQILRPTIVFGIGRDPLKDSFLHLVRAIKSGLYKNINDGNGIYNIISVHEVVHAACALDDENIRNGGIYFVNNPISFMEYAKIVKAATAEASGHINNISYPVAFIAATIFSLLSIITRTRMPLTLSRFRALTNNKIISQKRLLDSTLYRPLYKVEDYIMQVCKDYADKGLLT